MTCTKPDELGFSWVDHSDTRSETSQHRRNYCYRTVGHYDCVSLTLESVHENMQPKSNVSPMADVNVIACVTRLGTVLNSCERKSNHASDWPVTVGD